MNNKHKFLLDKEIYIKPPIGVMPKEIWKWYRAKELGRLYKGTNAEVVLEITRKELEEVKE